MEHQGPLSSQGLGSKPPRATGRAAALLLGLSIGLASACAPLGTKPSSPPTPREETAKRGAPAWAGMPLGWDKLVEIERWLRADAPRYDAFWRVQGELILNEGRVSFAADDLAAGKIDEATLRERGALAREGFQRVLADPRADAAQRARAERGLAQLGGLAEPAPAHGRSSVVPRAAWKARPAVVARLDPVGGTWTRITVHHSDAVPGTRLDGTLPDTLEAVRKIQVNAQDNEGWGDIGYHYLVDAQGRVLEGRSLQWQGAHAGGQNNVRNIGICLLGDFEHRPPSPEALAGLERLLDELRERYRIQRTAVLCHRDLKSTVCPGDAVASWVRAYERGANVPLAASAPPRREATPASWRAPAAAPSARSGGGVVR